MNQRLLKIDGVINFRDLGGYKNNQGRSVSWGKVYRSAQLDRLSERGIADMAALGIKTVVDLRFSDETASSPTIQAAVPDAEILSWHDEYESAASADKIDSGDRSNAMKRSWGESLKSRDPAQVREAMRSNYPKKLYSHRAIYRKMLLRLASGQMPLVFHCAAGKDRTGVAAALILSLLGVSDQQIVEDYLLTQPEVGKLMESWRAGGATGSAAYHEFQKNIALHSREVIQPIFDADVVYIETLLDYVNQTYGGFYQYARQTLALSDQQIDDLSDQLLSG